MTSSLKAHHLDVLPAKYEMTVNPPIPSFVNLGASPSIPLLARQSAFKLPQVKSVIDASQKPFD